MRRLLTALAPPVTILAAVTVLALGLLGLAACDAPLPSPAPTGPSIDTGPDARDGLAALAAAAKDRRYVATYLLSGPDRSEVTVTVAFATDGSWVVAVPRGALSGVADIAIYHSQTSLYQCLLGRSAGTATVRPDLGPLTPACIAVTTLDPADDPRIQHVFTDWIDRFVDRNSALSVATTTLAGLQGSCFSVESNSAALAPPVDPGVYCYSDDGTLTYARAAFGTLLLAGTVAPAPPSVAQPAPLSAGPPIPTAAPPAA